MTIVIHLKSCITNFYMARKHAQKIMNDCDNFDEKQQFYKCMIKLLEIENDLQQHYIQHKDNSN
ncbi:hypothetical protein G4D61_07600 [Bacillus ginsengihumi]|uniref:Uncharacterized protein n=1 Tax=Heyndrickxia ginsengihumi TaxID=363870 RepID=A0A6M0P557_9BACI|nr:hypothetical protein [Heyndrickxia ginsengihumi]NEY19832.1 hypothetical protein [Heyndrickxia ginsengihumi]